MAIQTVKVVIEGPDGPTGPQGGGSSFVVNTLAEMLALPVVVAGDLCYVIAEANPLDNGQYVANTTGPVVIGDWTKTQQDTAWGTITEAIDNQVDLQTYFKYDTSTSLVDVSTLLTPGNYLVDLVTTNDGDTSGVIIVIKTIGSSAIKQVLTETIFGVSYERVSVLGNGTDFADWTYFNKDVDVIAIKTQLQSIDNTGIDVDTVLTPGLSSVDTNLPALAALGDLKVVKTTTGPLLQELFVGATTTTYTRVSILGDGTDWSTWDNVSGGSTTTDAIIKETRIIDKDLIHIDTIVSLGKCLTSTGLPSGFTDVELAIVQSYDSTAITQHITEVGAFREASRYSLLGDGSDWSPWVNKTQGTTDVLQFNDVTGNEPAYVAGTRFYANGTMNTYGEYPDVTLQDGHELHIEVVNNTAATIVNGSACRHNGVSSGIPQVVLALADTFTNAVVLGITTHDILPGATGLITTYGSIGGIDTTPFPLGVPLYLSSTVAGTFTASPPDVISQVGGVLVVDSVDGSMFISLINNVSLPVAVGLLKGQNNSTYNLSAGVAQTLVNYSSSTVFYATSNTAAGVISIKHPGLYDITISVGGTISDEEVNMQFDLFDITTGLTVEAFSFTSGRGSNSALVPFNKALVSATTLNIGDYAVRMTAASTETVEILQLNFILESIHFIL